jgi:hypothetical protein
MKITRTQLLGFKESHPSLYKTIERATKFIMSSEISNKVDRTMNIVEFAIRLLKVNHMVLVYELGCDTTTWYELQQQLNYFNFNLIIPDHVGLYATDLVANLADIVDANRNNIITLPSYFTTLMDDDIKQIAMLELVKSFSVNIYEWLQE